MERYNFEPSIVQNLNHLRAMSWDKSVPLFHILALSLWIAVRTVFIPTCWDRIGQHNAILRSRSKICILIQTISSLIKSFELSPQENNPETHRNYQPTIQRTRLQP